MDTFAQQIARVQELLNTHPEIGMAVGGFGLGVVVASLFALFSRQKLLARALAAEARVEAQHEALEQAGEVLDERFRAAAQDAPTTEPYAPSPTPTTSSAPPHHHPTTTPTHHPSSRQEWCDLDHVRIAFAE